jgi:hypothetical protein
MVIAGCVVGEAICRERAIGRLHIRCDNGIRRCPSGIERLRLHEIFVAAFSAT